MASCGFGDASGFLGASGAGVEAAGWGLGASGAALWVVSGVVGAGGGVEASWGLLEGRSAVTGA
jgi:hypothetical protein